MTYEIKYRREDEMKDSEIEWLGKIPREWKKSKVKYNINFIQTGSTPTTSRTDYYEGNINWFNPGDLNQEIISESKKMISNRAIINNEAKLFRGDSVLIVGIGATSGKTSYLTNISSFNQQITGIHSKKNSNKYIFYQFKNISNELLKLANFTTLPILNNEFLKNVELAFPIPDVQQKIANFLDLKTAEFDSIISKKELLIERLEEAKKSLISEVVTGKVKIVDGELLERKPDEMKDSGVQWLGMIPKDWEVKRVKHLSEIISKGTTPSTVGREIIIEGTIRYLKAENIVDNRVNKFPEFYIDTKTNQILSRSELKKDDIVFVIAGATIGKVAILNKESIPANTNQAISFIRLSNKTNSKFVHYWLSSLLIQNHMWTLAVQSAQPNLSMENLGNFYIPWPNGNLIKYITDHLDKLCSTFDSIITKTKLQIQKLKQAKQSLISEAVTGKIDLRDWEIQ